MKQSKLLSLLAMATFCGFVALSNSQGLDLNIPVIKEVLVTTQILHYNMSQYPISHFHEISQNLSRLEMNSSTYYSQLINEYYAGIKKLTELTHCCNITGLGPRLCPFYAILARFVNNLKNVDNKYNRTSYVDEYLNYCYQFANVSMPNGQKVEFYPIDGTIQIIRDQEEVSKNNTVTEPVFIIPPRNFSLFYDKIVNEVMNINHTLGSSTEIYKRIDEQLELNRKMNETVAAIYRPDYEQINKTLNKLADTVYEIDRGMFVNFYENVSEAIALADIMKPYNGSLNSRDNLEHSYLNPEYFESAYNQIVKDLASKHIVYDIYHIKSVVVRLIEQIRFNYHRTPIEFLKREFKTQYDQFVKLDRSIYLKVTQQQQ